MDDPENQNPEQYPKMRICSMPMKKRFQVCMDTHATASYSGPQFDARFTVEMNKIVREAWRLKKSYMMTFSFLSRSSTFAVSGITSTKIYKLHIDLGKGTPTIYQYNAIRAPAGTIRTSTDGVGVYVNPAASASFDIPVYFNCRPNDNPPVYVQDLININVINLNLTESGGGTFNVADDATINTNTKYVCCLTFEEI